MLSEVDFCELVEHRAKELFGVEDGADLCFNLLDSGVINEEATIDQAARIVAQHIHQA